MSPRLLQLCGVLLVSGMVCAIALPALDVHLGIVFPAAKVRDLLRQCSRETPRVEGTWTPDQNQVTTLEKGLIAALAAADAVQNYKRDILHIARQYGGIVVSGHKLIYVNGFSANSSLAEGNWRRDAVRVCDGGPNFFGVEYDPANRSFTDFAFNGVP
jgi:hypothetical protein